MSLLAPAMGVQAQVTVAPPAGFDELAGETRTLIDLVYGGDVIGATPARFENDTITLEDPKGVSALIPAVRDHEAVSKALTGSLETRADLLCRPEAPAPGCGYLETETAGLIFNRDRLEAELFVNALYTYGRDARARYLPPPTVAPGLIATGDVRLNHDYDRGRSTGNGRIFAIAGHGRHSLSTDVFAGSSGRPQLRSAAYTHEGRTRAFSAGFLEPDRASRLATSYRLIGARYSTSLNTRLDRANLRATPILVSLNSDAVIEIRRAGATLDVQQVPAGVSQLDTSRLPNGSYTITLRIVEDGVEREEERFFTSVSRLPPADMTVWHAEAGLAARAGAQDDFFPNADRELLVTVGARRRLAGPVGTDARATLIGDLAFAELGLNLIGSGFDGNAALVSSTDGELGYALRGSVRGGRYTLSGDYRSVPGTGEDIGPGAPYRPFPRAFEQASLNGSLRLPRTRVGVRGFYRKDDAYRESWFAGPFVDYDVVSGRAWRLSLMARVETGSDRETRFLGVRLNRRFNTGNPKEAVSLNSIIDARSDRGRNGRSSDSRTIAEAQLRSTRQVDRGASREWLAAVRSNETIGTRLGVGWRSNPLHFSVEGRRDYQRQDSIFVGARSGIAIGRGGIAFTTARERSGALVRIDGEPGTNFDLRGSASARGVARSGASVFTALRPFEIHDLGVRPSEPTDIEYDHHLDRLVMYPGNVVNVERSAQRVVIVIGRLVDGAGRAISGARIVGDGLVAVTDGDGFFQADMARGEAYSVEGDGVQLCGLGVGSDTSITDDYHFLGDFVCANGDRVMR